MAVKFTKPEINVREKLAELDKPSGIAGEAMLRAETVAEQRALIGVGRRNLVMNGGFDVWQRGTTVTPVSNTYQNFTADRWSAYFGGTYTQQQTTLPNGDYVNYFRGVLGTTGGNRININNFIENGNRLISGKEVTITFWLKTSVIDSQINVKLQTTSGSNFSSYILVANRYIESSTSWKKYEITLRCNDDIANIGARPHVLFEIDGVDGSWANGTTFEIAQVQIELGRVATPFEHRSYGEELALCERYYQKVPIYGESIMGQAYSTTAARFPIQLPVEMRATPTLTVPPPGTSGNSFKPLNYTLSWPGGTGANAGTALSNRHFYITCTNYSGLVAGNASTIYSASNNIFITASAEL
jgi:hypothetical protein